MSKNGSENTATDEEIVILTGEDCPPCHELKKVLDGSNTKVKYRFVDVNSEEGKVIVKEGTEKLQLPLALKVKRTVQVEEVDLFFDQETVLIQDKNGNITPIKEKEETTA